MKTFLSNDIKIIKSPYELKILSIEIALYE